MKKIILIDGNSIVNRAYFGLPDLTTSKGMHTNGIKGFLNIFLKLINTEKPEYAAIAFDVHEPTFRHKEYKDYKAQRKPMEEALYTQFPVLKKLLHAMGIFVIEKGGYEADDLIGTMAEMSVKNGVEAVIVSGDKDLLQLVKKNILVKVPVTKSGKTEILDFNADNFAEKYELPEPKMVIDYKAIMGDASDNYKGVQGIGKEGAKKLITEYGSVDGIYEHLDEIKGAMHDKLLKGKDDAYFCKWLATIKTDCDIDFDLTKAKIGDIFTGAAYDIVRELEFKSMFSLFEKSNINCENETKKVPEFKAQEFLKLKTPEDIEGAADKILKLGDQNIGFSYSAYKADDGFSNEIGAIMFTCGNLGFYLYDPDKNALTALKENLKKVCAANKKIIGYGIKEISEKFDEFRDNFVDLLVASYLLYPLKSEYTVSDLGRDFCSVTIPENAEVLQKLTIKEALFDGDITGENCKKALDLLKEHAVVIKNAYENVIHRLKEEEMYDLFTNIEMPLVFALRSMEIAGVIVNRTALTEYGKFLDTEIKALEKQIYSLSGTEFNINSPKQLGEVLFEKLKLPYGKKTKTGYSTNAEVLEKLKYEEPVVALILKYREYMKLKGTYADGMQKFICGDNRIHTTFNQTVTATGRLSSTDPNLQNIPIRKENGREIRRMFEAENGYVFIDADYSQIELRLLAAMSGDSQLIEAYKTGQDIHLLTAAKVFNVPPVLVTPEMRSNAKAVNFGIIYGMSSFGLGNEIKVSKKQAEQYISQYFETYPTIKNYLDGLVKSAREKGYSKTLFNRRRLIPDINNSNYMLRTRAERIAMNSPIQGTAADIMKIALVNVYKRFKEKNMKSRILLQVHDELLIESPESEKEEAAKILSFEMTNACDLSVTLEVAVGYGKNWDEAHD